LNERILFADLLRGLAIVAVIVLHVAHALLSQYQPDETWWWIGNLYDAACRWCVPVFIMISGMLLLRQDRELSIKQFLTKRFARVLFPFLIWGVLYLWWRHRDGWPDAESSISFYIFKSILQGPVFFHFWFVYMILGLYLLTPILKVYVKFADRKNIEYLLLIWLGVNTITPYLQLFWETGFGIGKYLEFSGYAGYFVLGYYLSEYELKRKKLVYALGIAGFVATALGTYWISNREGEMNYFFEQFLSINVVFFAVGVFYFFKNVNWEKHLEKRKNLRKGIIEFSAASFGIYLTHALVLQIYDSNYYGIMIDEQNFISQYIHPVVGVPLTVLTIVVPCFSVVWILRKIPYVNKVVV
jgi:surface polysaccharide O-acyltransferase-like enzyme